MFVLVQGDSQMASQASSTKFFDNKIWQWLVDMQPIFVYIISSVSVIQSYTSDVAYKVCLTGDDHIMLRLSEFSCSNDNGNFDNDHEQRCFFSRFDRCWKGERVIQLRKGSYFFVPLALILVLFSGLIGHEAGKHPHGCVAYIMNNVNMYRRRPFQLLLKCAAVITGTMLVAGLIVDYVIDNQIHVSTSTVLHILLTIVVNLHALMTLWDRRKANTNGKQFEDILLNLRRLDSSRGTLERLEDCLLCHCAGDSTDLRQILHGRFSDSELQEIVDKLMTLFAHE